MTRKADQGLGYGGSTGQKAVTGREPVTVIDIRPQGCTREKLVQECRDGMATVHVEVTDETVILPPSETANSVLVCDITWQTGDGGAGTSGDAATAVRRVTVDATRGFCVAVGATDSLRIDARFVSAGPLEPDGSEPPLVVSASKRVEATVKWGGSSNPKKGYVALPAMTLAPDVPSDWLLIPQQARTVAVMDTTASVTTVLTIDLAEVPNVAAIRYRRADPAPPNWTPVVQGVQWVRMTAPDGRDAFFVFELWF